MIASGIEISSFLARRLPLAMCYKSPKIARADNGICSWHLIYLQDVLLPVKGADISNRLAHLPGTNHSTHDLARARLGQAWCKIKFIGYCQRTNCRTHVQLECLCQFLTRLIIILENDKDFYMLALHGVGLADSGSLGNSRMADQAGLD